MQGQCEDAIPRAFTSSVDGSLLPRDTRHCAILTPFQLLDWYAQARASVWLDSLVIVQVRSQPELTSASVLDWSPTAGTLWMTNVVVAGDAPVGLTLGGDAFVAGAPLPLGERVMPGIAGGRMPLRRNCRARSRRHRHTH